MRPFRSSPRPSRRLALIALLAFALGACTGSAATSGVAAQVGEVDISVADVEDAAAEQSVASEAPGSPGEEAQAAALTALIRSEILRQAAEELGVEVTDEDVAEQRAQVEEQAGSPEALEQALEQAGVSPEQFQQSLREQAIQTKIIAQLSEDIDDDAVRSAFDDDPQGRFGPRLAVRHVLTETRDEAQQALRRIRSGEDFAEVAADLSIDPGSAESGGDLGDIGRGETVEPFEEAAYGAEVGELVGPVRSEFGFHVIEVTDRIAAPEFGDVEEQIRDELTAQSGGPAFADFITGFISDRGVEIDEAYGTWDENAVAVVPPGAASEAPAVPAPQPSDLPS